MEIFTTCTKRRNQVNLFVHTGTKKIVESLYYAPQEQLIRRQCFEGETVEEVRRIYLDRMERHREMGYVVDQHKEGKVVFFSGQQDIGVFGTSS